MISSNVSYDSILEELKNQETGQRTLILPDTFLIKVPKFKHRIGNSYLIQHINRKEILLIDTVHEDSQPILQDFIKNGYSVAGLLLTHSDLIHQSYTSSLEKLSKDLGDTSIYIHPLDAGSQGNFANNILEANEVFDKFSITVDHFPGHTGGSVIIHSEINNGMLFCGDSAVGAPYDSSNYYFERPPISNESQDLGLAQHWKNYIKPFKHILPLHGKPQFDLSEGQQKDIIIHLSKNEPTKHL
ncbi:MBL fold metallo-hydrolase [Aquimarina sp. U1-2]|uniref:MBL fold metallo-hydrolase n=1 Tax=Aquimarina sp. U1-2 TaxID=2823141 RepID=UPI001AEC83EA|nr:MBL fold metallo-hydrolase [Aquimarina sp. U1-2]MBP2830687.1 MBL fold metallo-hydrolase [Aquimarina sp. U1-2]